MFIFDGDRSPHHCLAYDLPRAVVADGLLALNHDIPAGSLGSVLGLDAARAQAVYDDIGNKRRTTRYLHMRPLLVEPD